MPVWITGEEALDVSRMTDIPLAARLRPGQLPDTYPGAVDQGAIGIHEVYIDLGELPYWDRMRVAWARIGGYTWIHGNSV